MTALGWIIVALMVGAYCPQIVVWGMMFLVVRWTWLLLRHTFRI